MQRIVRAGLLAWLVAGLVVGCGKKTMETPPPVTPPPAVEPAPPPPAPPPAPAPAPAPAPLVLEDVYYDYDSSTLRDDAKAVLTANGRKMVESKAARVTIEGHCDERGTVDYNLALGDRRAKAAKDFLVTYGVDAGRVTTISYGESRPFAMGHDESAWAQNRRAHFVVEQ